MILFFPLAEPQGVYVLQDHSFRWLLRLAAPGGPNGSGQDVAEAVSLHLALPCGIVRGVQAFLSFSFL